MVKSEILFMHAAELDGEGYPRDCPFDSQRAGKTLAIVESLGLIGPGSARVEASRRVSRKELEAFHTADYLDTLEAASAGNHTYRALSRGLGTPDCPLFSGMYEFITLAAGGTMIGAQHILDGAARSVFNPSGGFHHAHSDTASGFCYINDVVLAAIRFRRAGWKVLVVDIDAHHADGVQNAFYGDSDITVISMHESGKTLFPGTGEEIDIGVGDGRGHSINIPLPVGTYDAIYYDAFQKIVLPIVRHLSPDVILLELGMDGLAGDPLAHLNLTNNSYADITGDLVETGVPILATGGGGYNIENTVRGWALAFDVMVNGKQDEFALTAGLGGVMLENTAWFGGLRDRTLLSHGGYREVVDREVERIVAWHQKNVFPLLGI